MDVWVWDQAGTRRLESDGRALRVHVPGSLDCPHRIVSALAEQAGIDAAVLRVASGGAVEVELLESSAPHPAGFRWRTRDRVPAVADRPPWQRPGWLRGVAAGVDGELARLGLTRTGALRQVRHTTITGMLRIPTERGGLWLKSGLPIFSHEGPVTRWLGGVAAGSVPTVLVCTADWWISAEFPAEAIAPRGDFLAVLADLQIRSIRHVAELRALGCPDRPLGTLPVAVGLIADRSDLIGVDRARRLRALGPRLAALCEQVDALGVPPTLVHGDLNPENVRWVGDRWLLFDWTDSCITHPFIDLAVGLSGSTPPEATRRSIGYAEAWSAIVPQRHLDRLLRAAPALGAAHQVANYQRILEGVEPTGGDRSCAAQLLGLLERWVDRLADVL